MARSSTRLPDADSVQGGHRNEPSRAGTQAYPAFPDPSCRRGSSVPSRISACPRCESVSPLACNYGHWSVDRVGRFNPENWFGFVYLITGPKGRYVGSKVFRVRQRLKPLKGKTRHRRVVKESNWRTYTGSCDALNADIAALGKDAFRFEILELCSGRSELTYSEIQEQVFRDVLRDPTYYNRNIGTRHYSALLAQTERSEAMRAQRPLAQRVLDLRDGLA